MALWSLKGKKVLIVDDFAEMRSSLRNMVSAYGADEITTVATGDDAVSYLCEHGFDIVLCDYNLGDGKDGQQILEEAKHRNRLPYSTVFIMVTAENTLMMVMGALEYQPDEYLSKPFTQAVMQRRLQRQLTKKEDLKPLADTLEQKNTPKAIEICDQLISDSQRQRNERGKLKCELLIESQEYDQALTICQETLLAAVEKPPKSVSRQRSLAKTAEYNEDFSTAEYAHRRTIHFGKNSIMQEPTDYQNLAMMQIKNNHAKNSLRTIELMTSAFKDDNRDNIELLNTMCAMYRTASIEEFANQIIEKVRREITKVNNRGVKLLESSKLDEAQAYLMKIKKSVHNEKLFKKARTAIDSIKDNAQLAPRYKTLFNAITN